MKLAILLFLAGLVLSQEDNSLLVTPDYIESVNSTVDWEVESLENSIFKGMTVQEFRENMLGDALNETYMPPNATNINDTITETNELLNATKDWQNDKCTHQIRDQKGCGSCWAFTTASLVADRCCMETHNDYGWLAPQELISCDEKNYGCTSGLASKALQYVSDNGLVPETCFPYAAKAEPCPHKCSDSSVWSNVHHCICKKLVYCGSVNSAKQCLQKGPIAVRMIVYQDLTIYKSGIYCWDQKSKLIGGHAVRCVGYSDTPKPHFNCANTWGTSWGQKGYFWISTDDKCGMRLNNENSWTVEDC